MTLRFKCPECGKKLKADEADVGRKVLCTGCGTKVIVPPVGQSTALSYEVTEVTIEDITDESLSILPKHPHSEDLIDMTPMVDVVLFLLIFFLVTSVQALQAVIDMPTPQTVGAAGKGKSIAEYEQDPDFISVRIEDDDSIWVEDTQTFADQDLRVRLRAVAAERERAPSVVVIGNPEATHGAAVRVFDACAYARVKEVSFVVQESDASK